MLIERDRWSNFHRSYWRWYRINQGCREGSSDGVWYHWSCSETSPGSIRKNLWICAEEQRNNAHYRCGENKELTVSFSVDRYAVVPHHWRHGNQRWTDSPYSPPATKRKPIRIRSETIQWWHLHCDLFQSLTYVWRAPHHSATFFERARHRRKNSID